MTNAVRAGVGWVVVAVLLASGAVGQTVDVSGPSFLGRCEQGEFQVLLANTHLTQTMSTIIVTHTRPNAGFAYVPGSGLITLDDGTPVLAEPTPSGLNLTWDLNLILGTAYELPPGEIVTVEFALVTGCGTISGTLGARVDFVLDETGYWVSDSQPVEILPGAVRIEKIPSVISAGVGDEVTWTLVVENTGLGPIYNVVVTDVLGSGLLYVSSSPAGDNVGQTTTWDESHAPPLEEIAPGGRVEIELRAEVTACSGLDNRADVQFGCDDGSVCFNTAVQGGTATASVALIPRNPFLSWTPPTIEMPYCSQSGVPVTIPVTNTGLGAAYNIRLCMDCSPLVVSDVGSGAIYEGGCFVLDDPIPAGETYILTFTVTYLGDWCADVPSGTVLCQSIYENVCGEEFRPPLQIGSFSTTYGPDGPPRLSVSLTGPGEVYICDVDSYNLEVSFSGLDSCGSGGTSDISVVANVPAGFTVTDEGGGTWVPGGDGTGGTISWTTSPAIPLSTSFTLAAPGTLQCGQVATLSATAIATDCCGCGISASDSAPIAIQCYQLVTASRTATPTTQEKCGEITYTNTYTFVGSGPDIYFTELTFIAYAENLQEYVDGTLQITVDGVATDPVTVVDTTPGGSLEIQGIDDASLVWGKVLVISYRLKFTPGSLPTSCPSTYSFYTWTTLDLGPGCTAGENCTQPCQVTETLVVAAVTPSMSVAISGLPTDFVDPCGTYNVTVTLTKTSTFDPHDVRLRLGSLNYYIVDTGSIGCSGVCPTTTVPTEYADYYEWDYADAFVGQPNGAQSVLAFQVRKRCGPGRELRATALFTDSCLYSSCSVSASRTPSFLRQPLLYVSKTPEIIYATRNPITWTIYVTNGGAGPAYEVWVDDVLGSGLEYVSSAVDSDVQTYPNEDHEGFAINGVSWRIPVIAPGATRTLTVTARMATCAELTNWVQAGVGCGGEDCLISAPDSASVVIPTTNVVATASTNSPINTCAVQYATITVRNAGDPAVYDLVAEATLPLGISYVSGSAEWRKSGGSWAAAGDPVILGSTLTWTKDEVMGLAELRSRQTLDLRFQIRADCAFTGGSLPFQVSYLNVCSAPGSTPVGTFTLDARQPQISVTKTQASPSAGSPLDCGGNVTWQIVVRNTGPIPVPYVLVGDEMAPGFTYISSSPLGNNMGSITTWEITDLPLNGTATLTLTARTPGAGDSFCTDLSNTVRATWGCPPPDPCLTDAPASDTIQGTRTPTVSLSTALSPSSIPACGEATFTLTVQNTSTAAARAVDARITLPSGLSYVPGSTEVNCGGGFVGASDPTIVGQALTWYDENDPGANLCMEIPANSSVQVRFRVKADCYVTAGNASIRVWYYDCCETTQRTADGSRSIARATPTLTITKLPATVPLDCHNPNNEVTWTVTVTNTGTASADWVRVEDTLGANLVYVGSYPAATAMGAQKWGWEFGPLGVGESRTLEITVRLSQPANDCGTAPRTNTASAWWGCGPWDGDPNTVEGCTGGGPVTATARVTIPDLNLVSTDILPILTCVGDGNYTGRVQITIRNLGDAPVNRDFRLTLSESATGWTVAGWFAADFGGTLPIAAGGSRTITIPNWPVTCGICSYTFSVTLDTANAICECRENNNVATRAFTITLPDLTARDQNLTLTCAGDGQVRISGTLTLGNEGCGNNLTANVPVRFTLYNAAGCNGTVLRQWTQTLTGVNIPAKGQQTFTIAPETVALDACAAAAGCTLSVRIEVDPTGAICECDGTNNARCVDLPVNIPDLTVRADTLALTCAGDGEVRISGTVTLGNEGCGGDLTAGVPVRFTLREGSSCTGALLYTWNATFTGVNIPAKGEQTFAVSRTFTLNLCQVPGCAVSLLIEADYTNSICECSGTNNSRCVQFPVLIPDLAVTAVVPDVPDACRPGTAAVTVTNVGCGFVGAGVTVQITGDATGEIALPSLGPGVSTTVTVSLNEVLPCGGYAITATVDPEGALCECSAGNNAQGASFAVVDPDLTITGLSVLCRGEGSFTVVAAVRNLGTEASPATTVRVYVDDVLFQTVAVPSLGIGGTHPVTYVTPRIKCGVDQRFRLVVDEDGAICECNEGNNSAEASTRCGCPALVTRKAITKIERSGSLVPPASAVEPGDLVTYTLSVTNVGTGWAFDVDLWDELPVEFNYVAGSTSASWPGGSSTADPSGVPGPYLAWDLSATLLPRETLTLSFRAFVTSLARQGLFYTNRMGATGEEGDGTPIPPDSRLPGDDDPDDRDEVIHPANVPGLALDKAIADVLRGGASRGPSGPVEPGDVVVYKVTIRNVGGGTAYNVDFTDQLPDHTEYTTAYGDGTYTVDNPPAGPASLGIPHGATGSVTANISAAIAPGGTLTAVYRVRVLSTVSQGVPLVNSAVTTGEDGAGTPIPEYNPDVPDTFPDRDTTRIEVVEPGLALDKEIVDILRGGASIWPTPIVLWGDVLVYRVTVRNVGLGTAYNVDLSDELPFGLAYDASGDGAYTVDNPPAGPTPLGIPDGATGLVTVDISATVAGGGTLVAIYRARVTPEAIPGSYLTNLATVAGEDGAGTRIPEFNADVEDTYPDSDSTTIRVGAPALVTKKEVFCEACPCEPEPAPCDPCVEEPVAVTVGSRVTFRLIVTNVGYSRAYDVIVEDRLPPGFVYVAETTRLAWPGGKSEAEPVGAPGPLLAWVTGASLDAGETLTLTFDARVTPEAPLGEEIRNTMGTSAVDDFGVPIPADSSMYVPADNDPDDLSILRLIVGSAPAGAAPPPSREGSAGRPPIGWASWGMAVVAAGIVASRFGRRGVWLGLVLGLGLAGLGMTASGAKYTVAAWSDPPKGGTLFGTGIYEAGEGVHLTALPNPGFEFGGWFEDGAEISTLPLLEFVSNRDRTLIAKFRPVLEFVGISGLGQGALDLLPAIGLRQNRFELRPRFLFGTAPWDLRLVAAFTGAEWKDAQGHFTGSWDKIRFGAGLLFNPIAPEYRSAYFMASWAWEDLRVGLRVTHYPRSGTPPAPYLLYNLSLSTSDLSVTVRAEERDGLTFKDLTVYLFGVDLCCGIEATGTLSLTKQGFAYVEASVTNLPLGCCGVSFDFEVKFAPDAKTVSFTPRWAPFCDACLTVHGDIVWDANTFTWGGFALYGYKIRCCLGSCCPGGSGSYVEFLTAFDPSQVPGGFQGDEFEYIKVGACGPGCCGGSYTFEVTAYFAPTGLFGLSRISITAGIPLSAGLVVSPTLEVTTAGLTTLALGWRLRF